MNHEPTHYLADVLRCGAILLPLWLLCSFLLFRGSASLLRGFWRGAILTVLAASLISLVPPFIEWQAAPSQAAASGKSGSVGVALPGAPTASLESVLGLPEEEGVGSVRSSSAALAPARGHSIALDWATGLALLWLLGVLLLGTRRLLGQFAVLRIRLAASPVHDPAWQNDLSDVRNSCGISSEVGLHHHPALRSPIVTGIHKPVILLPPDHAGYDADDRRAVLLHELAHIRHRDALMRTIASLVRILHWPNPLAWFAERSMRLAEERAADDAVLEGGIAAPAYAALLAQLAKGGHPIPGGLDTAGESAMAQGSTLLPRVQAILRTRQARHTPGRAASWVLLTTMTTLAILAGGSAIVEADPVKDSPTGSPATAVSPSATRNDARHLIDRKLDTIIIPSVEFEDATLRDALDAVLEYSRRYDEGPEQARGINIIAKLPKPRDLNADPVIGLDADPTPPRIERGITLKLEDVPLRALLVYVCRTTGATFKTSDYAVIVSPLGTEDEEIISENFRIGAEILEAELRKTPAVAVTGGPADPFAAGDWVENDERRGLSAKQWLSNLGVVFPPGAGAFFTRQAGTLMVSNTPSELEFVRHIIDSLNQQALRAGMTRPDAERLASMKTGLQTIIIPNLQCEQASLTEALEYLRIESTKHAGDIAHAPVQFVYNMDRAPLARAQVTLTLRQVPLGVALKHIVDLAGMQATVGPYGIEISPRETGYEGWLQFATFDLSPAQMSQVIDSLSRKPEHPQAISILSDVGIDFPQGAGAFWNKETGKLLVRNAPAQLALVETFLEGLTPPGDAQP